MASYSWPLSLPASGGTGGTAQLNQVNEQLERKLGTDIFFAGYYVISPSGDYATISGIANLIQSIYRRLLTIPGEYAHIPEYGVGVPNYVKRKMTRPVLGDLKRSIIDNLLRDPRIQTIDGIDIEQGTNNIQIGIRLTAEGQALRFRPFNFSEV